MKKYFVFLFLLSLPSLMQAAPCQKNCGTSKCVTMPGTKAFFRPRAILEEASIFLALANYNNYYETRNGSDETNNYFYLEPFYQKQKWRCELNALTFPMKELGENAINALVLNLNGGPVDIIEAIYKLSPDRKIFGTTFNYRHVFTECRRWWIDLRAAVVETIHSLCPTQTINVLGVLTDAQTPQQFLSSERLNFAKISSCPLKKAGFDDIELRIGYSRFNAQETGYNLDLYGSVIFPTSKRPTACFTFEPLIGRAHWGLGGGLNAGYTFWQCEDRSLTAMTDLSYDYLFSRCELRSLDLKCNGFLSRFLLLTTESNTISSFPAVNVTTRPVNVTIPGDINLWAALHYQQCNWHVEVGYNLWWKHAERVCVKNCCSTFNNQHYGVFDLPGLLNFNPVSASTALICQPITGPGAMVSDPVFVPITLDDLDPASASHPETLTNKIYLSVGYKAPVGCNALLFGLTASFERANPANAIEQWGIWGTVGIDF